MIGNDEVTPRHGPPSFSYSTCRGFYVGRRTASTNVVSHPSHIGTSVGLQLQNTQAVNETYNVRSTAHSKDAETEIKRCLEWGTVEFAIMSKRGAPFTPGSLHTEYIFYKGILETRLQPPQLAKHPGVT